MINQSTDPDLIQHQKNLKALIAAAKIFDSHREKIANVHPNWKASKDTRHEIFARCNTAFNCTTLLYTCRLEYLSQPIFWSRCEPPPSSTEINKALTSCDRHSRFSLIHGIFCIVESSIRIIAQSVDGTEYSKRVSNFHDISSWLFTKSGITNQLEIINLFRHIRNTVHNNGAYYHHSESDKTITWKDRIYSFSIGKHLDFLSWMDICPLLEDLGNTLNELVASNLVTSLQSTPESIGLTNKGKSS